MKADFQNKLKNLQEVLGLKYTVDQIYDAQPGTEIYKEIRKIKEAKERAANLKS